MAKSYINHSTRRTHSNWDICSQINPNPNKIPFHDKIDSYSRKNHSCHTTSSYQSYDKILGLLVDRMLYFLVVFALEKKVILFINMGKENNNKK